MSRALSDVTSSPYLSHMLSVFSNTILTTRGPSFFPGLTKRTSVTLSWG
eukprot:CAMPEP_0198688726 /NCGR_PEP_ID=MMETSP1468-20131203/119182_1 /TAXON_ID=1461545 /ORGANISM="Mantoniella sp, Strain CCMP1436" /LENGTH=48 /DNA_ID= /DNA_START= /DNA_END= /DNA_ORIENTATION=